VDSNGLMELEQRIMRVRRVEDEEGLAEHLSQLGTNPYGQCVEKTDSSC
jgi:hypothetical protein